MFCMNFFYVTLSVLPEILIVRKRYNVCCYKKVCLCWGKLQICDKMRIGRLNKIEQMLT